MSYNLDPLTIEPPTLYALIRKEMNARKLNGESMHRIVGVDADSLLRRIRGEFDGSPNKEWIFKLVDWLNNLEPVPSDEIAENAAMMVEKMLHPNGKTTPDIAAVAKELRSIRDELRAIGEAIKGS